MRQRAFRLLGDIDLSFLETLNQIVRCEIDQLDRISPIEHRIRHGLADAHMRDLSNDVIETFDVLNVDGRVNVDAAAQYFLDIEVAFWMAATGRVGVSKLIDKNNLGSTRQNGVEIHFLKPLAFVFDTPTRND